MNNKKTLAVLLNMSGLGDCVASLPAINFLIKQKFNFQFYCFEYLIDLYKPFIPKNQLSVLTLPIIDNPFQNLKEQYHITQFVPRPTTMKIHQVDYNNLVLTDGMCKERNYPKYPIISIDIDKFHIDLSKAILITMGYTNRAKAILSKTYNDLIDYIICNGYIPVMLGCIYDIPDSVHRESKMNKNVDLSKTVNLINETTIPEIIKIMSLAKCIIGSDGGLIHLAGMTDIPIIASYTYRNPNITLPIRNNILGYNCHPISTNVKCKFCMSDRYNPIHNYDNCLDDGSYKCVYDVTVDKFVKELEDIL